MMPDLQLTIEDMIAEGDKVVCKNHWRRTNPQSGKKMGFRGFVMWRFEGDGIADRWATVAPRLQLTRLAVPPHPDLAGAVTGHRIALPLLPLLPKRGKARRRIGSPRA